MFRAIHNFLSKFFKKPRYSYDPKQHYPTTAEKISLLDPKDVHYEIKKIIAEIEGRHDKIPVMVEQITDIEEKIDDETTYISDQIIKWRIYYLHPSLTEFNSEKDQLVLESCDSPNFIFDMIEDIEFCKKVPILIVDGNNKIIGKREWKNNE